MTETANTELLIYSIEITWKISDAIRFHVFQNCCQCNIWALITTSNKIRMFFPQALSIINENYCCSCFLHFISYIGSQLPWRPIAHSAKVVFGCTDSQIGPDTFPPWMNFNENRNQKNSFTLSFCPIFFKVKVKQANRLPVRHE